MNKNHSYGSQLDFGEWLKSELRSRGMSQEEFADRVGVSQGTVSRWALGRQPAGKYIDPIADVLLLDYDMVATRAGYRPRGLPQPDPESATARLRRLIEVVNWDLYPTRLETLERELRFMIEHDQQLNEGKE